MTDIIYPRSPRETMCGWMHLPRYIDKIRLHLAGKLDARRKLGSLRKKPPVSALLRRRLGGLFRCGGRCRQGLANALVDRRVLLRLGNRQ